MNLPKKLDEWFLRLAVINKVSPENAVIILFPQYLVVLLALLIIVFSFLGLGDTCFSIAWPFFLILPGIEGIIVAIKREVPGQPWMRGKFVAVLMGMATAIFSFVVIFFMLFSKK